MWSRRSVLTALAASALAPSALAKSSDRKLVVVLAQGGWDVSFALDPKLGIDAVHGPELAPGAGTEERRSYGSIEIAANDLRRPSVSAYFERWSDQTAVINGVSIGTLSHPRSISRVLSGHWDEGHPDLAAVFGAADRSRPLGMVDLSGFGQFGAHASRCARWGRQGQARALLDPNAHFASPDLPQGGPWMAPDAAERAAVDAYLDQRAESLENSWRRGSGAIAAWRDSRDRAIELRDARPPLGSGLPWGWAASAQGDVDLVVELLARDVCRSVLVSSRQRWDTHAEHDVQHTSWNRTFFALDELMTALSDRAMLDQTTILVVSEMTRTPRLNGHGGKDHWPWTSFLVAGAGVRGGVQLGGTDDELRGRAVDPESGLPSATGRDLEPAMVLAGVAEILGVDAREAYPGTPVCRGFAV